jgi:LysM repeat protein
MSLSAPRGPFIAAKGYTRGRLGRRVRWIGIHTAEGATHERDLGHFFARTKGGSSHAGIGQDGGYAAFVNYSDTPWTNPPLNSQSDTLEICGFAKWKRSQWMAHDSMLESVARWIAWRAAVRGIPIRHVTGSALRSGVSGVVGHIDVNNVFHESQHWDPGPNFPWDEVLNAARHHAGLPAHNEPVSPLHVTPAAHYTVNAGDSYWKIAQGAYHDGAMWPTIADANGRGHLKPGMVLTIPPKPTGQHGKAAVGLVSPTQGPPPWPGTAIVAIGRRNSQVARMQHQLMSRGYHLPHGATGYYGPATRDVLSQFQQKHPQTWPHDGICGPVTWGLLFT